jgi:hypothetical protein
VWPNADCPWCYSILYVIQATIFEGRLKPITRSRLTGKYRIGSGKAIYKSYETAESAYDARAKRRG